MGAEVDLVVTVVVAPSFDEQGLLNIKLEQVKIGAAPVTTLVRMVGRHIYQQRLETVREFLVAQGLDPEQLTIVAGLDHGRGQHADEAALFYEANLMPDETSSSTQALETSAAPATE